MVSRCTDSCVWEAMGNVDRMDRLANELDAEAQDGVPENLEDLYWFMRNTFESASVGVHRAGRRFALKAHNYMDILHSSAAFPKYLGADPTTTLRASDHDAVEGRFKM